MGSEGHGPRISLDGKLVIPTYSGLEWLWASGRRLAQVTSAHERALRLSGFLAKNAAQFGPVAFGTDMRHTPDSMAPVARKLDPVTRSLLDAPVDDEPLTKEDIKAMDQADKDIGRGDVITTVELKRRLGL